jgi:adenylate kinase family enzyme
MLGVDYLVGCSVAGKSSWADRLTAWYLGIS